MNWDQILTVFAVIATNLGTVLALYMQLDRKLDENRYALDKKLDENRKETNAILSGIQAEMKDFHGRLERQDAEIKAHLLQQYQVKLK
jgi:hypothetical protein